MAASNRTTAFTRVLYAVNTTGDVWFNPTVGTNDSPDYSTAPDKANALTQCALNSPEGEEVLGS
jgi:hypothetical protein